KFRRTPPVRAIGLAARGHWKRASPPCSRLATYALAQSSGWARQSVRELSWWQNYMLCSQMGSLHRDEEPLTKHLPATPAADGAVSAPGQPMECPASGKRARIGDFGHGAGILQFVVVDSVFCLSCCQ